jgi:hypothetical protein
VHVDVAFERKRVHDLSILLNARCECDKLSFQHRSGFLCKLAARGGQRVLVLELALRDGPGTFVLARPERPAGMGEEHHNLVAGAPIEQDSSAAFHGLKIAESTPGWRDFSALSRWCS